jgi:hypothetical protein
LKFNDWKGPTPKKLIPNTTRPKVKRMDSKWMARLTELFDPENDGFDVTLVFGNNEMGVNEPWLMQHGSDIRFSDFPADPCKIWKFWYCLLSYR